MNVLNHLLSNIYTRRVLAGEFIVINKHLVKELMGLGQWNESIISEIIRCRGSVQTIQQIPQILRDIYKTVWELKQKVLVDMARDRGFFVCQSQSLNLFFEHPNYEILTKALIYGWKRGLKTGSYYIRSKPAITSQQFTVNPTIGKQVIDEQNNEPCEVCSA